MSLPLLNNHYIDYLTSRRFRSFRRTWLILPLTLYYHNNNLIIKLSIFFKIILSQSFNFFFLIYAIFSCSKILTVRIIYKEVVPCYNKIFLTSCTPSKQRGPLFKFQAFGNV